MHATPHRSTPRQRRTVLSITLLSFASGLPLGLVWYAIPDWMRSIGVDIRIVGLTSLTHAPWVFKTFWSPLLDRYAPPVLTRRRGWILIAQIALCVGTLALSGVGDHPDTPWVILALTLGIAFASATQDIVIDAYAVDALRREEHGLAVGVRTAAYRLAMMLAGAVSITLAGSLGWPIVTLLLAALYIPLGWVTIAAPEPQPGPDAELRSLRDAVWLPFLDLLTRHRALQILAFVVLYKLSDNLSQALLRPFLIDMGYNEFDRGVALGTVGVISTICGTLFGGIVTKHWGLGRCLWWFGLLQIGSNVGYILVAQVGVHRPLMYGAMAFEMITTGLGMGAFGVLLLRLTEKRFSATQYALLSSLFALPRLAAGPVTGAFVHAAGWVPFFVFTMVAGIPGLVLLSRFAPWGVRDPKFEVLPPLPGAAHTPAQIAWRGISAAVLGVAFAFAAAITLEQLGAWVEGRRFDWPAELRLLLTPDSAADAILVLGSVAFGVSCGLFVAAVTAARSGRRA